MLFYLLLLAYLNVSVLTGILFILGGLVLVIGSIIWLIPAADMKRQKTGKAPTKRYLYVSTTTQILVRLAFAVLALTYHNVPLAMLILFAPALSVVLDNWRLVLVLIAASLFSPSAAIPLAAFFAVGGYLFTLAIARAIFNTAKAHDGLQETVNEFWQSKVRREQAPTAKVFMGTKQKTFAAALVKRGSDDIIMSEYMANWQDKEALHAVLAHEVRHTQQGWLEWNKWLVVVGAFGFLTMFFGYHASPTVSIMIYAASILALVLSWALARYAEVDADKYACEEVDGEAFARGLELIAKDMDYQGAHSLLDVHPRLEKRITRARATV